MTGGAVKCLEERRSHRGRLGWGAMSEHAGWDAEERVVDLDEMFGDVLPEQTGDDLADRDTFSTGGSDDTARIAELIADRPPHYED